MQTTVVSMQFHAPQNARTPPRSLTALVAIQSFRAIVRSEHNQRVLTQLQFLKHTHQPAHSQIQIMDAGIVLSLVVRS